MNATVLILITLIIVIALLVMIYITKKLNLTFYAIRTEEAEKVIEEELNKRYDLIIESKKIVNKNTKKNLDFYEDLEKAKNTNISTIEFDKKITASIATLYLIKNDHPKLNDKKEFKEIVRKLNESDTKLNAAKSFYNSNTSKLNEQLKKFPTNLIGKINKYKILPKYEAKEIFNEKDDGIKI